MNIRLGALASRQSSRRGPQMESRLRLLQTPTARLHRSETFEIYCRPGVWNIKRGNGLANL
ncbi:unnamed protein product, partial [Nesidiocoris tenuis]